MADCVLIPERLIKRREALELTKTEAASLAGMNKMTYGRYENGERNPSIQVIKALAEAMSTSVDYLTGNSDDDSYDIIYINRNEKPILFSFVNEIVDADDTMIKSLKKYYKKLLKQP